MSLRVIIATIGAIACLAAVPASSLGQSLSNDAYSNQTSQVLSAGSNGGGPPTATSSTTSSGTLPFTGLQIALVGLVGAALIGSGFVLKRVNRSSDG